MPIVEAYPWLNTIIPVSTGSGSSVEIVTSIRPVESALNTVVPGELAVAEALSGLIAGLRISVEALPETPVVGQEYLLTVVDDVAKAAPGVYRCIASNSWICLEYYALYDFGNLGATPTLNLIPRLRYKATQDQAISSCTIVMSAIGIAELSVSGSGSWATPTMAARTSLYAGENAWVDAAEDATKLITFEDDGTTLWLMATKGVTP